MTSLPLQIRAAVRLADVYCTRAAKAVEAALQERLAPYQRDLSQVGEAMRQAVGATSETGVTPLHRHLRGLVKAVEQAARPTCQHFHEQRAGLPGLRSLLDELRQLDDEFGGLVVNLKQKSLRVETQRIVLEDVDLGPFAIELGWSRLLRDADIRCFQIEALDPCPASGNDEITHPHVQNGVLCAGDATVPIQLALGSARLADAFLLVRSVLMHYNPASPYVSLDNWDSEDDEDDESGHCDDCGYRTSYDDLSGCSRCGNDYCSDCLGTCHACDERICSSCEVRCAICEEGYCPTCLRGRPASSQNCCKSCHQACSVCGTAVAKDQLDPVSGRCASCDSTSDGSPALSEQASPSSVIEPIPSKEINNVSLPASAAR